MATEFKTVVDKKPEAEFKTELRKFTDCLSFSHYIFYDRELTRDNITDTIFDVVKLLLKEYSIKISDVNFLITYEGEVSICEISGRFDPFEWITKKSIGQDYDEYWKRLFLLIYEYAVSVEVLKRVFPEKKEVYSASTITFYKIIERGETNGN